jgi:hypothetical protein
MAWAPVTPQTITWSVPVFNSYLMTEDGKYLTDESGNRITVSILAANPNWVAVTVTTP